MQPSVVSRYMVSWFVSVYAEESPLDFEQAVVILLCSGTIAAGSDQSEFSCIAAGRSVQAGMRFYEWKSAIASSVMTQICEIIEL